MMQYFANRAIHVPEYQAMEALGGRLSTSAAPFKGLIIYLTGDLGAGKTTLVRGYLRAMGHLGSVKSPTYTLVEPYEFAAKTIYHFDFYRLHSAEELEYMGIRDYLLPENDCLIEWPEKAEHFLPEPDLWIKIEIRESARKVTIQACNQRGQDVLQAFPEAIE